jgi:hypothetical protein
MNILLQFYLEDKQKQDRFLFWSCVLDSSIDLSKFKLNYLDTSLNIENFANLKLQIEHKDFTHEILNTDYKGYNKNRPEVFLSTDATMQTGSPYRHASSMMKTYYQVPSVFVSNLTLFCDIQTDYQFTKFQLQIISTIRKELGIDIIKNESLPGCLSVYRRMPGFSVNGNYNASNGKTRYITITPNENNVYKNAMIEIEIYDRKKVLFRKLCKYTSDFYFEFPSTAELEHFSEFRISIYHIESENESYSKIYEEHFHLVRTINIMGNIYGSNSKIVKNRYANKSMDKIDIITHQSFNSITDKKDWVDWEEEYKNVLFGKKSKYLESLFFDKITGREEFLNWARNVISMGRKITIVDPYFDNNGLQDFYACINTHIKIRILMKDPHEFNIDTNTHLEAIYNSLPGAEVFFVDNIHDRYLIIEEDEKTVFYSLSNSWNGTVNNYSLYIQEVPLLPSLQIKEEIENHVKNGKFQANNYTKGKNKTTHEKDETIYTELFIRDHFEKLKSVENDNNLDDFINICSELFWAYYFKGDEGIIKNELITLLNKKINSFSKEIISEIISIIIVNLIRKQKEKFIRKNRYLDNKPFGYYDTPEKCLERIGLKNYFGTSYFDLDLDYALYELLKTIFFLFPETVIEELTKKEDEICILYIDDNGTRKPMPYYISEPMVSSFLAHKYPSMLPLRNDIIEFIKKVKNIIYCRIFFASDLIYHDREKKLTFNELMELLKILELTPQELLLFLSDMYCKFSIQKQNRQDIKNIDIFLNDINNFVLGNYSNEDIIKYAYKSYIEPYEIKHDELKSFLQKLEKEGCNDEKQEIEKLLLLCASQTNLKLQSKIKEIINPKEYILKEIIKPLNMERYDGTNTAKYHNILPYLGYIFASFLEKYSQENKLNLQHTLSINKALVFPLDIFSENMGMFYYDVSFLLSTVLSLRDSGDSIKKGLLELLEWYLSSCLNAYSDDFYGLSIQVIDLYTTLQTDEKNKILYDLVNSLRDKILIASNIKIQTKDYIELYKKVFNKYSISSEKKDIIVFFNIAINLCLRCADKKNIEKTQELLSILEQIEIITREKITDEYAVKLINTGINYAHSPSKETMKSFVEIMDTVYNPYSVRFLFEAIDE